MSSATPGIEVLCRWQRGFPLVPQPYLEMARALHCSEADVQRAVTSLLASGVIARIGAVVRPNTAGSSTLAAIKVPPSQLERVADVVSAQGGVNHNYEREHAFNLWFVATGPDRPSVRRVLDRIQILAGLPVLDLPLERSYFIDLGFPLEDTGDWKSDLVVQRERPVRAVSAEERRILVALEHGLALVQRPYLALGEAIGLGEAEVLTSLGEMFRAGIISRFGLVVRHRALGFAANAMVVWNVADGHVDAVGEKLARASCVTLCYRRPRRLPDWRYNLFCMVHGKERGVVQQNVADLAALAGPEVRAYEVLFSRRCFKQRGASLTAA